MSQYVLFLALGLGAGSAYALLSLGLVIEYRSTGVINFAHGAMAMFIAYVFVQLRTSGQLILPVIVVPSRFQVFSTSGAGVWPSLAVSLVYALILGGLVYLIVFRWLRRASALAKVAASVGLLLLLEAIVILHFGTTSVSTPSFIPSSAVHLFGADIPQDRLWLAGISLVMAGLFTALFRWTRFGLATRAADENEKGAVLLGYSPDRLGLLNWMLATLLAGWAGILLIPITSLQPDLYTLFVVPALAAAVMCGFRSLGLAAVAGLLLGMAESLLTDLQQHPWFPHVALEQALPLVVIVVVMAVRGQAIPSRGELTEIRLPRAGQPRAVAAYAVAGLLVGGMSVWLFEGQYRTALIQSLIAILVCLSLVVVTGYVGQISLVQMAFAGVAGFGVSKLSLNAGVPFPLSLLLAAFVAVPVAVVIGLPALRVRGMQLAVVTIAAATAVSGVLFNSTFVTGGILGASVVPSPRFLGLDLGAGSGAAYPRIAFGLMVLVLTVVVAIGVAELRRSSLGRQMLAVRANERAAAAAGINVAMVKLVAFAISGFIAGIAGGLIGYQLGQLTAASFDPSLALAFLAAAYIGGIGRVSGAVAAGLIATAGGLMATLMNQWFGLTAYDNIIAGVALILVTIHNPDGIAASMAHSKRLLDGTRRVTIHRLRRHALAAVASEPPSPAGRPG